MEDYIERTSSQLKKTHSTEKKGTDVYFAL